MFINATSISLTPIISLSSMPTFVTTHYSAHICIWLKIFDKITLLPLRFRWTLNICRTIKGLAFLISGNRRMTGMSMLTKTMLQFRPPSMSLTMLVL